MLILGSLAQSGVFSAIVDHSGLPMLIHGLHGNSGLSMLILGIMLILGLGGSFWGIF